MFTESDETNCLPFRLLPQKTQFGHCYFDISQTEKRLVRATLKTYERTATCVSKVVQESGRGLRV